jgi:hypothetical protein
MVRLAVALALAMLPIRAGAQWTGIERSAVERVGQWEVWSVEDRLYRTTTAYIATATFREDLRLVIACSADGYTAYITLAGLSFEPDAMLNWRVEAGEMRQAQLRRLENADVLVIVDGAASTEHRLASMLRTLSRSDMLVFEIADGSRRARALHDLHQLSRAILTKPECDKLARDIGLR